MPVATDPPAAPVNLLKVIRCKCKMDTGQACSSQTCSCRKHGLPCLSACKNCNGHSCENIASQDVDEFSEYTQDDDAIQLPMNDSRVPDDCLDF